MRIIYDHSVPQWHEYDKLWKRVAVALRFRPEPDRTGYNGYQLPDGTVILHPSLKPELDRLGVGE